MALKNERELVRALGKALGVDVSQTYVAEVVREGDKIILPKDAYIPDVITALQRDWESNNQTISVATVLPVPPWDGAMALYQAINDELGLALTYETVTWLGTDPPAEIEVEVAVGKTANIKWGTFGLPGMGDAKASTGVKRGGDGSFNFSVYIECKRMYGERARKILDTTRAIAMRESLHRGKAFSIAFTDNEGDKVPFPTPQFFPFEIEPPIFREELEMAIDRNIFTPLRYTKELEKMGESLKRGVLLCGKYGMGKTLLASYIALVAVENGWTFIYNKNPDDISLALKYAQRPQFQPCVLFQEDVERVAGMDRTSAVNDLLNQIDGVDSKNVKLMVILSSNHPEDVNPAMRRKGRVDAIIQVVPPDGATVMRMVKRFAREGLEDNADLSGIAEALDGRAPSDVKEAVARARLEALRRTGKAGTLINGDDLALVAREVKAESDMFGQEKKEDNAELVDAIADGFEQAGKAIRTLNG